MGEEHLSALTNEQLFTLAVRRCRNYLDGRRRRGPDVERFEGLLRAALHEGTQRGLASFGDRVVAQAKKGS